jgi:hypothetical protein
LVFHLCSLFSRWLNASEIAHAATSHLMACKLGDYMKCLIATKLTFVPLTFADILDRMLPSPTYATA